MYTSRQRSAGLVAAIGAAVIAVGLYQWTEEERAYRSFFLASVKREPVDHTRPIAAFWIGGLLVVVGAIGFVAGADDRDVGSEAGRRVAEPSAGTSEPAEPRSRPVSGAHAAGGRSLLANATLVSCIATAAFIAGLAPVAVDRLTRERPSASPSVPRPSAAATDLDSEPPEDEDPPPSDVEQPPVARSEQPPVARSQAETLPTDVSSQVEALMASARQRTRNGAPMADTLGAISDCTRAIELDPRCSSAFIVRGMNKGQLGDHQASIQDYENALRLEPNATQETSGWSASGLRRVIADARARVDATGRGNDRWSRGSSMEEVRRIQGEPERVAEAGYLVIWYYGLSHVTINHGVVTEWSDAGRNLRVR